MIKFLWQLPCSETRLGANYIILTSQMDPLFTQVHFAQLKHGSRFITALITPVVCRLSDVISMRTVVFQTSEWEVEVQRRQINPLSSKKFLPVIKQEYNLYIPSSLSHSSDSSSLAHLYRPGITAPGYGHSRNTSTCANFLHSQVQNILAHSRKICETFC